MLTEQKPPWAAKFGVPNWLAHQPVSDCDWSRPVKKASFFGSVRRMFDSRSVAIEKRFLPLDLAELARAARTAAQQRLLQPRRAVMLHDAGAALAAQHAAIDRMILVAVDVADLAVLDVHVDAAAAGAHVAGGLGDAVGDAWRGVDAVAFVGRARIGKRPLRRCGIGAARRSVAHDPGVLLRSAFLALVFGPGPRM